MRVSPCIWVLTLVLAAQAPSQSVRRLTGKVLLPDGKPAAGAVVKLRNQAADVRTAISTKDGSFQFSMLLPDLEYQVRASYQGMESNRVKWSRFSSRRQKEVVLILRPGRRAFARPPEDAGFESLYTLQGRAEGPCHDTRSRV
jgi:hypothetical protein